jgi:hypothetical protein
MFTEEVDFNRNVRVLSHDNQRVHDVLPQNEFPPKSLEQCQRHLYITAAAHPTILGGRYMVNFLHNLEHACPPEANYTFTRPKTA